MAVEMNFEKRYRLVREVIETIVLTLLMFLVINLAVQNFDVDGMSMEASLHDKERLMVDKWTYLFHPPARGDVIVFLSPPAANEPNTDFVKRIIGIPGDVITITGTTVSVDGTALNETYISPQFQGTGGNPVHNLVVPPGQYFVLGDHRSNSLDSRFWGFLPRGNIIGRVALVYWPLGQDNDGLMPNVSSVFAKVHQQASVPSAQNTRSTSISPAQNTHSILDASTLLFCALPVIAIGTRRKRRRKVVPLREKRVEQRDF
jgi:signal peptidase I